MPRRPRQGFPWLGLALAVVIVAMVIVNSIGGKHAVLLARVYTAVIGALFAVVTMLVGIISSLRKGYIVGARRESSDEMDGPR
jgi:hypothetical protein